MSDPKASITDLFALAAETKLQITKSHSFPFLKTFTMRFHVHHGNKHNLVTNYTVVHKKLTHILH